MSDEGSSLSSRGHGMVRSRAQGGMACERTELDRARSLHGKGKEMKTLQIAPWQNSSNHRLVLSLFLLKPSRCIKLVEQLKHFQKLCKFLGSLFILV